MKFRAHNNETHKNPKSDLRFMVNYTKTKHESAFSGRYDSFLPAFVWLRIPDDDDRKFYLPQHHDN